MARSGSTTRGFKRTATILGDRIQRAGESRGFAVSRVLTHWAEIVGPDLAELARPVEISYGRGGFGATLTVLTTGAQAPMLEMHKERLRERVNAAYGYNALSRVRITQTAATGFSEGKVDFAPPRKNTAAGHEPGQAESNRVREAVTDVSDDDLRAALEKLGRNVVVTSNRRKGEQ